MSETSDRERTPEKYRQYDLLPVEPIQLVAMHCCGFQFDALHTDRDGGYTCPLCWPDATEARAAAFKEAAEVVRRFISVFPDPARGRIAPNALKPLANRLDRMAEASAKEGAN